MVAGVCALIALCAVIFVVVNKNTTAQYAATRQPDMVQYDFAVYKNLNALLNDGPVPIQRKMAILLGWTTEYDGNGHILLWSGTATNATNSTWIFAPPGLTNRLGVAVGRWFVYNTNCITVGRQE